MGTKLYVGNLTDDATVDALRKRFSEAGNVEDVQIATDRSSGRMRGYAFVTMATEADARSAITQLNGSMFDERPLRVNEAGERGDEPRSRTKVDNSKAVKITSQFRERNNMTYELDCAGAPLALRFFPTPTDTGAEEWRVEARTSASTEAVVIASAPTRAEALIQVGQGWVEKSEPLSLPTIDWALITQAMQAVRAI